MNGRAREREPATAHEADAAGRRCVLVLGMHRSGTSATTRVLGLLGAALPKTLVPARQSNQAGFWEPELLVRAHDRMLTEMGSTWYDYRRLDFGTLAPERHAAICAELSEIIASEYGDARLFVLKDPRICRFAPLYRSVLENIGVETSGVIPIRNPLAVVASLKARDGMSEGYVLLMWLRHVLDAEIASRDWPRAVISYETLVGDSRSAARRLAGQIDPDLRDHTEVAAPAIEAFVSRTLQHHAAARSALGGSPEVSGWVKQTYDALSRLERDAYDVAAMAQLDIVRREFEAACDVFGSAMLAELAALESRFAAAWQELATTAERAQAELVSRRAELTMVRSEVARLTGLLTDRSR